MTEPLKPELTVAEKVCELVRLTQPLLPPELHDYKPTETENHPLHAP